MCLTQFYIRFVGGVVFEGPMKNFTFKDRSGPWWLILIIPFQTPDKGHGSYVIGRCTTTSSPSKSPSVTKENILEFFNTGQMCLTPSDRPHSHLCKTFGLQNRYYILSGRKPSAVDLDNCIRWKWLIDGWVWIRSNLWDFYRDGS